MLMLFPNNIIVKQALSEIQVMQTNYLIYSHKGSCRCPAWFRHVQGVKTAYFSKCELRCLILAMRFGCFSLKMLQLSLLLHHGLKSSIFLELSQFFTNPDCSASAAQKPATNSHTSLPACCPQHIENQKLLTRRTSYKASLLFTYCSSRIVASIICSVYHLGQ